MTPPSPNAAARAPSAATVARVIAASVALIAALASSALALTTPPDAWELPGSQPAALAYALSVVALGAVAVVLAVETRMPRGRLSPATAATALALAWAALAPVAIPGPSSALTAAATVVAACTAPALLHLAAALSLPASRWAPRLVTGAYIACAGLSGARALVVDPFLDPGCRVGCDAGAILPAIPSAIADALGAALVATAALTAASAAVVALVPAVLGAARGARTTVALSALVEAVILLLPGARPLLGPPPTGMGTAVFAARCAAAAAVAVALALARLQRARRRARLAAAFEAVAEASGTVTLRSVLARVFKDPGLQVAYWLPTLDCWVDDDGAHADPTTSGVTIVRDRRPVARVTPSKAGVDAAELDAVVGAAARLVADNERLRTERRAQALELRESSRRIVETTDGARRRLERELHDGAQHWLLAAAAELRLAIEDASDAGTASEARARLDAVLAVLTAVREISRGLYPPTLDAVGLLGALESVARSSATPLSLYASGLPPLDEPAALTAYLAVQQAVASGRPAPAVATLSVAEGLLRIDVAGVPDYRVDRIADRVTALGGVIAQSQDRVRVEVPCES